MIRDAERRGVALAELYRTVGPRVLQDLEESSLLPDGAASPAVRAEWECFALYACVRGLVAAGGFNRETAAAIDAMHERVLSGEGAPAVSRALLAERYAEYGAIGQAGGKAGAATVTRRLGEAAARHMVPGEPPAALIELVGSLHESLAEGAAEAVRRAE